VHYIGLEIPKETIAVSTAQQNTTEVRRCGIIGGTPDVVDKLLKKIGGEVAPANERDGALAR